MNASGLIHLFDKDIAECYDTVGHIDAGIYYRYCRPCDACDWAIDRWARRAAVNNNTQKRKFCLRNIVKNRKYTWNNNDNRPPFAYSL